MWKELTFHLSSFPSTSHNGVGEGGDQRRCQMLHIFPLKAYFVSVRWLCGLAETQLRIRDQVVVQAVYQE